jgi:branched-chain amino acid transport system permease protein
MTVGILSGLTGLAGIIWSYDRQEAPNLTPTGQIRPFGITIGYNGLTIIAMTIVIMLAVVYLFKRTTLGIAMRAVADDRRAALLMGIPADRVSSLTWVIGTMLAGGAGILLSPLLQLQPLQLTLISIPAYAAVLFGGLSNLARMTIGAILVGVLYSEVPSQIHEFPGTPELAIFLAVIVFMFVTGKSTQLQEEEI